MTFTSDQRAVADEAARVAMRLQQDVMVTRPAELDRAFAVAQLSEARASRLASEARHQERMEIEQARHQAAKTWNTSVLIALQLGPGRETGPDEHEDLIYWRNRAELADEKVARLQAVIDCMESPGIATDSAASFAERVADLRTALEQIASHTDACVSGGRCDIAMAATAQRALNADNNEHYKEDPS